MRRQRKVAQMKEQDKTPKKRSEQNGDKQSVRCRVQTVVIRMLKELTGYFNSVKMILSEMKVTLIEIKKNITGNQHKLQGINHACGYAWSG